MTLDETARFGVVRHLFSSANAPGTRLDVIRCARLVARCPALLAFENQEPYFPVLKGLEVTHSERTAANRVGPATMPASAATIGPQTEAVVVHTSRTSPRTKDHFHATQQETMLRIRNPLAESRNQRQTQGLMPPEPKRLGVKLDAGRP